MKKIISFILVFALSMILIPTNSSKINAEKANEEQTVTVELETQNGRIIVDRDNDATVFIGGILIGYVIDGVIIYITGHSAAELTAETIRRITQLFNTGCKIISVNDAGFSHCSGHF